jgi:hypothetical protein
MENSHKNPIFYYRKSHFITIHQKELQLLRVEVDAQLLQVVAEAWRAMSGENPIDTKKLKD